MMLSEEARYLFKTQLSTFSFLLEGIICMEIINL